MIQETAEAAVILVRNSCFDIRSLFENCGNGFLNKLRLLVFDGICSGSWLHLTRQHDRQQPQKKMEETVIF